MSVKIGPLILCVLWLVPASIYANAELTDESTAGLKNEIQDATLIAGRFTQKRWMSISDQAMISKGDFQFERGAGMVWEIKTPFAISYRFQNGQLVVEEFGDTRSVSRKQEPMLYGFFSFFSRIFEFDEKQLQDWFEIDYLEGGSGTGHNIVLVPLKSFMKKAFSRAEVFQVEGKIQQVVVYESGGDRLELVFSYGLE